MCVSRRGMRPFSPSIAGAEPLQIQAHAMSSILTAVLVILLLILVMGLLSLSEFAQVSSRRWRLRERAGRGDRGANAALRLSEDLERFVPTVRLGMALAGTLAGVYAGITLSHFLDGRKAEARHALPVADALVVGGVVVVLTLITLLVGELLPRRIALQSPEQIATRLARPMIAFSTLTGPLVRSLGATTDLLARLVGVRSASRPSITPEEIKGLLWEGTQAGVFEEAEHEIFKRVFRFCERRARALMTPRDEVVWIDVSDSPEEIRRKVIGNSHSRFPVCDQSLDNLLGIVQVKDLLAQNSGGPSYRIKGLLTLPAFIYEGARGPQILELLKKSSTPTAVVLDEYGSVVGIVTLNDILEAVLGGLPEGNGEEEEPRSVQRADGSWLLDGRFPLDEFREMFDLAQVPEGDFHTLAGLVVTQLGHIPRTAESFEWLGLHFEVVDMDSNRVDRVLVRPVSGIEPKA
jgi:putative hemolysin